MKVIFAPEDISLKDKEIACFLAGTIDQNNSVDWQKEIPKKFKDYDNLVFYNPRRPNWDATWGQTIEDKNFKQQVDWELQALDVADVIFMTFLPNSKSPISLLEFSLYANSDKMIVYCPEDFYRSGNVYITALRYNIPVYKTLEEATSALKKYIDNLLSV